MIKAWKYCCMALAVLGVVLSIRFTILCWEQPWPHSILTIDGRSYLKGAEGADWTTLFELHDLYHSPGYQVYLRLLFSAVGSVEAMIEASKLVSLAIFFASAALLYRLGRRWFRPEVAQSAVALFLLSESWRYYCNMIQYEVLTGFLILLFLSMLIEVESIGSSKLRLLYNLVAGLVLAFISLIQMRYVALFLVPLIHPVLVKGSKAVLKDFAHSAWIVLISLLVLAAWSVAQTSIQGRTVYLMDGSQFRFHVANNPNAMGYSFPYPQVMEPSGWQFIFTMPRQWLWLLGQRVLYLFGIKRDIWALPPQDFTSNRIGSFSTLDLLGTMVFAAGLWCAEYFHCRGELTREFRAGVLLLACVMLPPLLIFGSKRFIIPVIPLIALFQGYAIVEAALAARLFSTRSHA